MLSFFYLSSSIVDLGHSKMFKGPVMDVLTMMCLNRMLFNATEEVLGGTVVLASKYREGMEGQILSTSSQALASRTDPLISPVRSSWRSSPASVHYAMIKLLACSPPGSVSHAHTDR